MSLRAERSNLKKRKTCVVARLNKEKIFFLEVGFMNKKNYERLTMYVQALAVSDVVRTSAVSGGSTGGGVKEPNDLEWDWD